MSEDLDASVKEVMLTFYRRLYPFKPIFNWLNHQPTPTRLFTHREFAFTLPGDVYLRYNSFSNSDDLKKQVCVYVPTRFEIGPVYSARPKDKKTVRPGAFKPMQRELVFDIDMTDYDPVRTCCSDTGICKRCWGFIAAAVRILDTAIRDQYGYQHLLWVYSGRRGIHLWISDKEALELTDEQRKAVVNWMSVVQPGKDSGKKVNVRSGSKPLPPSLQAALRELADVFSDLILRDQDCFGSESGYEALLQLIPDSKVVQSLRENWSNDPQRSSEEKWDDFKNQIKKYSKGSAQRSVLTAAMEDIILQYTYPRLDAEVSKHRNHLLKAPFCVHPKTGRICVPVDPSRVDEFDPEMVPTVGQLLRELDTAGSQNEDGVEHHSDWERTGLKPYVDMLNKHVQGLMEEVRREKREMDTSW
ncbi:dna primase small subunit [Moniliophthora roreri MCA 2997]|uniref:DNA primase n=1 Tax=Moniliophthora roreri (strain MCA 2997) TaxID=1381753 RepID=V2WVY8_MONRO|nr:dna primase small subunit [Moniliophthora roreri MCA 2997]KAI3596958.1 dna primase small subunit [Moniliophthora roreri]